MTLDREPAGARAWPTPAFARGGARRALAIVLGCSLVALDFTAFRDPALAHGPLRPVAACGVVLAYLALGAKPREIGWRLQPVPSFSYWRRVLALYTLACVALIAVVGLVVWLRDMRVHSQVSDAGQIPSFAFSAIVHAPLTEELIYRVALCAPLAAKLGRFATIALSAAAFGYLHVRWGNFELTHPIGGAIAAWAYLRSGCLWVPIALHAITNTLGVVLYALLFFFA